ncbi:MAG: NAD-dependent DNA ligase LigA [Pseudobdellovibrionaceae bacterium]
MSNRKRYEELKKEIFMHDHLYHVLDKPEISDYDYDQLYNELLQIEKSHPDWVGPDSPSLRVGSPPLDFFEKAQHTLPMLSLSNSYSVEDLFEFDKKIKKFLNSDQPVQYFCEPKYDGLALELIYEHGVLVRALTRGDGVTGEDVTANVKTIRNVPLRIPVDLPKIEVRGEVLMFKKDFQDLNTAQEESGENTFANPRNAAAGSIRQLDSRIAAQRMLKFMAYAPGFTEGLDFKSQSDFHEHLAQWGFRPPGHHKKQALSGICESATEVIDFYHAIHKIRKELDYDIDGIVVKVNLLALQQDLGLIAKSPRWATAAKYPPEQATTTIEEILVQVGRTGALTPVAVMKPVKVGGVTVTHATLHNQDEIDRKDLRIADTVVVQRAGDVIPEIVSVLLQHRSSNSHPYVIPQECPSCGTKAIKTEEEAVLRCPNRYCPAVRKEALKHFVSRKAMNLDKIGDRLIETLYDEGLVRKFSDLYRLTKEALLQLDRQGDKSAENIIASVSRSKNTTLERFIYAQGIRFVGEQTAHLIADHFGSLASFLSASDEELLKIPEVGPKVLQAIKEFLHNQEAVADALELTELGVQIQKSQRNTEGSLTGMSFLITGTLPVKREFAKDFIESHGGKFLSGVSSKLNYLVVGEDPGSKLEKAEKLGVKIITWEDLQKII